MLTRAILSPNWALTTRRVSNDFAKPMTADGFGALRKSDLGLPLAKDGLRLKI